MNDLEKEKTTSKLKWLVLLIGIVLGCIVIFVAVGKGGAGESGGGIASGDSSNSGGIFGGIFTTHPNSDPEKARDALESAGYDVELKTYTFHKDRVIAVVDADNGSETDAELEWIIIHYFEDEAAAEEAWPEYQKEGEAFTEAAIYLGYGSSFVYRKNGATIYTGTKSAVDAAE